VNKITIKGIEYLKESLIKNVYLKEVYLKMNFYDEMNYEQCEYEMNNDDILKFIKIIFYNNTLQIVELKNEDCYDKIIFDKILLRNKKLHHFKFYFYLYFDLNFIFN
jgi:hypothetical protein